ncbi:MAG: TetR/AcrR family transcriptional regulator [Salinisphaera sp.]|nr:TetR/AcrR family transcriptional regulator [Salinisphaera sp.]
MGEINQPSVGAENILQAAKDLFAERGFDSVSIAHIADQAGSSKANIFHHFGSKDGLYMAVLRQATERATAHFQRAVSLDAPQAERVESAILGSLSVLFEDPERARLIFREVLESNSSRGETLARDVFTEEFTILTRLFADAQQRGVCANPVEPAFLAFLMVASNVMLFHCQNVLRHLPGADFVDDQRRYAGMLRAVLMWVSEPEELPCA